MFGITDRAARKPLRPNHALPGAFQHALVGRVKPDIEIDGNGFPKIVEISHRPVPEVVVVAEVEAVFHEQKVHEMLHP